MAYRMKASPTKLLKGLIKKSIKTSVKTDVKSNVKKQVEWSLDDIRKSLQKQLSEPVIKTNPYIRQHPQTGKTVIQKYGKPGQGNIKQ
jgi:hypothetical protein